MKSFILDTDTCIFALNGHPVVLERLVSTSPARVAISVITEAELRLGAAKSTSPVKTLKRLKKFLHPIKILEFTSVDAAEYGKVRAKLEKAGTPIGPLDTLIGSHALARSLTLITNNVDEFGRIDGLQIENWTLPPEA